MPIISCVIFFLNPIFSLCKIINVYNQQYESGAAFWPDVQRRLITALIVAQLLLMGLMSNKRAAMSTPMLVLLPVLTIWFHIYCKNRFEPAFVKFPLQVCEIYFYIFVEYAILIIFPRY